MYVYVYARFPPSHSSRQIINTPNVRLSNNDPRGPPAPTLLPHSRNAYTTYHVDPFRALSISSRAIPFINTFGYFIIIIIIFYSLSFIVAERFVVMAYRAERYNIMSIIVDGTSFVRPFS